MTVQQNHVDQLREETELALLKGQRVGLLGLTPVTIDLLRSLAPVGLLDSITAIYDLKPQEKLTLGPAVRSLEELHGDSLDVLVVCSDEDKEVLIEQALPYITGTPRLVIAGFEQYRFRDPGFTELLSELLVPSIANGYDNCQIHLYQCLTNAAKLGISGAVVEFGTYKGGTSVFLANAVKRLGQEWPVFSLDTYDGFPPRRSPLDMYNNPDCEYRDKAAVLAYTSRAGVQLIEGDIVETASQLADHQFVLSFFDTDNYSSAMAGLDVVRDRTAVGGAIIFDHWVGRERFRYTLGERFAARVLLEDKRYFNLHGTGVFLRQA